MWAFSGNTAQGNNVTVTPAAAFAAGTEMAVIQIGYESVIWNSPMVLVNYDITFWHNGEKAQPDGAVMVRLAIPKAFPGPVDQLVVTHKGVLVPARAVKMEGIWYMEFETDQLSLR